MTLGPNSLGASTSPPPERVAPSVRLTSVVAFLIFSALGATARHALPELGLAFVTGSAMFVTPDIIEAIVSSKSQRWGKPMTYIKTIALLALIAVSIVGFGAGTHELSSWKLGLLVVLAALELTLLFAIVPLYLLKIGNTLFERGVRWIAIQLHRLSKKPLTRLEHFEDNQGFFALGAGLFFLGTTLQFIAGL